MALIKYTHILSNQRGKYSDSNHRISRRHEHMTGFTIFMAAELQYLNTTIRSRWAVLDTVHILNYEWVFCETHSNTRIN